MIIKASLGKREAFLNHLLKFEHENSKCEQGAENTVKEFKNKLSIK